MLEPLIEEVRPPCQVPHENLRQMIEVILWQHQNGAKWRSTPSEVGPWWKRAQTIACCWAQLGVWERLLDLMLQRGRSARLFSIAPIRPLTKSA